LLACPTACSSDASFDECRCQCWDAASDEERSGLSAAEVYGLLSEARILEFLLQPMGGKLYVSKSGGDGKISFKGLSMKDNNAALRKLLDLVCSPGKVGPMGTDAAANDPLFWALHLEYDRLWHSARLEGYLGVEGWPTYEGGGCPGSNLDDTLPFAMFNPDDDLIPTNEQLYAYFAPDNADLPYVYDNFLSYDIIGVTSPPDQDDDAQDAYDDGTGDDGY
jgi:hypothetical protein